MAKISPKNGQAWSDMAGVLDMWQITFVSSLQNMSYHVATWVDIFGPLRTTCEYLWIKWTTLSAVFQKMSSCSSHGPWWLGVGSHVLRVKFSVPIWVIPRVDNRQILKWLEWYWWILMDIDGYWLTNRTQGVYSFSLRFSTASQTQAAWHVLLFNLLSFRMTMRYQRLSRVEDESEPSEEHGTLINHSSRRFCWWLIFWKMNFDRFLVDPPPVCEGPCFFLHCYASSSTRGSDSDAEFVKMKPTWLPKCLYTSSWGVPWEVKDIMRQKALDPDKSKGDHGDKLTMFDVSGPAVKWLWIATAIHWPFALVLPVAAYDFTDCNGLGMPRYRVWLWGLAFPVLATMIGIEWKCFLAVLEVQVSSISLPWRSFAEFCCQAFSLTHLKMVLK